MRIRISRRAWELFKICSTDLQLKLRLKTRIVRVTLITGLKMVKVVKTAKMVD